MKHVTLAALFSITVCPVAWGGVTMSLTHNGMSSVVLPCDAQTVTVELRVQVTEPWVAFGAGLSVLEPEASGLLRITGRTFSPPFIASDALVPDEILFGERGILDPVTANIGHFRFSEWANFPAGDYLISVLTVEISPDMPLDSWTLAIGNPGGGINMGNISGESIPVDGLNSLTVVRIADTDGDAVCDDQDACIDSDLAETITIDGCDTGVANAMLADGCTMADEIADLAATANNHGAFVNEVTQLTNAWGDAGLIQPKEKALIRSCAARAGIGRGR